MFAFGQLKITPKELDEYTLHEFFCAWHGYQETLIIQRLSTCYIMKATIGGNLRPTDLYEIHSDKKVLLTRNEVQELADKAKELWQTQN